MRELYLVRHGIAVEHGAPGFLDDDRPLTEDGVERMRRIGLGLRALRVEPDRIVSSPLPRARHTAELVAEALVFSGELEILDLLRPSSKVVAIQDWLDAQADARVMLVGHNPGLSLLIGQLLTRATCLDLCDLDKGGVAALSGGRGGAWSLLWLATPRMLKKLG